MFLAWKEFQKGKLSKIDVLATKLNAEELLLDLHNELLNKTYVHSKYQAFYVYDPKKRHIHKAEVRDRILHHAIHRIFAPVYDKMFIYDSYSSRVGKGMHKAMDRFREFGWKISQNNTKTVWVLKCDIRKFFDSVDHEILKKILAKKITDTETLELLNIIINSFNSQITNLTLSRYFGKGIPLGNLTSQLFSNIYMDRFDQYVKRELRVKYYIRYADDFVILSHSKNELEKVLQNIKIWLLENLKLEIHKDKVFISKLHNGVDFLGFVHFPYHRVLRTKTKKRMFRKLNNSKNRGVTLQSYLGVLKHGNCHKIKTEILKM